MNPTLQKLELLLKRNVENIFLKEVKGTIVILEDGKTCSIDDFTTQHYILFGLLTKNRIYTIAVPSNIIKKKTTNFEDGEEVSFDIYKFPSMTHEKILDTHYGLDINRIKK